jgi:uncharacterized protein YajQ (UPF0234 family)
MVRSQFALTPAVLRGRTGKCADFSKIVGRLDKLLVRPQNLGMADASFDIVSEINLQEVDNAITQAQKEIGTRYDFKGSAASVEFNRKDKELTLTADGEPQLESVRKVIVEKLIKRGVDPKSMDPQKIEQATHKTVRQKVKLKEGIDKDTSKKIQKQIKDLKLKVNASIQGEALRVSGSKRDDLQAVIAHLRANPVGIPLQFNNFR